MACHCRTAWKWTCASSRVTRISRRGRRRGFPLKSTLAASRWRNLPEDLSVIYSDHGVRHPRFQGPDRKLLVEQHGGGAERGDVGADGRELDARLASERLQTTREDLLSRDVEQWLAEARHATGDDDLLYVERADQARDGHAETAARLVNNLTHG